MSYKIGHLPACGTVPNSILSTLLCRYLTNYAYPVMWKFAKNNNSSVFPYDIILLNNCSENGQCMKRNALI